MYDENENFEETTPSLPRLVQARDVTIRSTQLSEPFVCTTDAATFGQLQQDLQAMNAPVSFANTSVLISETGATVANEQAVLPLSDVNLMVYPSKAANGRASS